MPPRNPWPRRLAYAGLAVLLGAALGIIFGGFNLWRANRYAETPEGRPATPQCTTVVRSTVPGSCVWSDEVGGYVCVERASVMGEMKGARE